MKKFVTKKEMLKTTIALSAFVLVGCSGVNSDEYYWDYSQETVIEMPQETDADEYVFIQEEEIEEKIAYEVKRKPLPKGAHQLSRSVSASSPAKPRVVPPKPTNKCVESQTVTCPFAQNNAPKDVEVKEKPKEVATKEKRVISAQEEKAVAVPLPTAKPAIKDSVIDNSSVIKKANKKQIVDNVIESETKNDKKNIAIVEDLVSEKDNKSKEKIVIVDDLIDDDTPVEIEFSDNLVELENQKEQEEALRKAQESARLNAQEEARQKQAQEDEKLAQIKANQEAERARLKEEMEALEAQKKALEEEKIKISQIQRNAPQSCEDVKDWVAAEGTTLRSLLLEWGNKVGWRVIWNMDRDYTLEAGAVFRGRFVDVAAALLRSFARATPAPKGVFYKGNKVLVISTREDENAD